ncbi:MAG: hypothetical protein A2293_02635 [Elusimicrobia bacterium RIFOXYB2_FULL_49_7]|nr:MAG: hypothetical protein A2293_02635 [Elusimicrobia bacterium RIFOXYB2_FULL_49_7]
MATILIADDEGKMRALLAIALNSEGHEIEEAATAEEVLSKITAGLAPDLIISDIRMGGHIDGLGLLSAIKAQGSRAEVIIMTAHADARTGVEAMKRGAFEYVIKPFEMDEMVLLAKSALEKGALRNENRELKEQLQSAFSIQGIIGTSPAMQAVFRQIKQVGPKETTVIIRGRSGTGKELVARAIHGESGRREFVAINCSALPENLLESELFGHEKGSFTGAHKAKIGLFEKAGNGTLFLDEIGDLSADLQAKLLRVLQERTFRRVGGNEDLISRARIISATHRNLEECLQEGLFREDLYYRINVFPIFLPTLSERKEDLSQLIDHFLGKYKGVGIEERARLALQKWGWPGNIRELENAIQRLVIVAGDRPISYEDLPVTIRDGVGPVQPSAFRLPENGINLEQVEKEFVLQAIQRADGNKSKAAELLGISRRSIYSKMKTHHIKE